MVMSGRMLHSELTASVSGTVSAHGLQVEDVNVAEVPGCQLLKPGPVPSLLHFARFRQNPSFISFVDSYCNTADITHNKYSSDNG